MHGGLVCPDGQKMPKVLVCTDFSDAAAAGLRAARARFAGATLLLLHVVDDDFARRASQRTGLDPEELAEKAWTHADVRLEEAAQAAGVRALIERGDPVAQTIAVAEREQVDCIVVGVDALVLGAPGGRFRQRIVRAAPAPVLFVFDRET